MTSADLCACCRMPVGKANLVWDHCHPCGTRLGFRGWICNGCNIALSEHIIRHWEQATQYLSTHECSLALFDMPDERRHSATRRQVTRRLYIGNGGGDRRYVMAPSHELGGVITIEQLGVVLGVAAGTARDLVAGRRGNQSTMIDGTHFVDHETVIELLKDRWSI